MGLRIEESVNELSRRMRTLYGSLPDESDRLLLGRLIDLASEVDPTVAAASVLWVGIVDDDEEEGGEARYVAVENDPGRTIA